MTEGALLATQAAATIAQGVGQKNGLDAQAIALDENARRTDTQGAYDAVAALRQSRLQEGVDITSGAASGSGLRSISDLLEQNAMERQLEALNIQYGAAQRSAGLRAEAKQKRSDGRSALFGSVFRAGAGAITGVAQNNAARNATTSATQVWNERMPGAPQSTGSIPIPKRYGG